MQQKNYRNFHFGNTYSDCFVAVKQQQSTRNAATRKQAQAQTQKYNLKQKQGQVQVEVIVGGVNSSYEQQVSTLRNTKRNCTSVRTTGTTIAAESVITAFTKRIGCSNSTTLNTTSVTATTTPTPTSSTTKTDTDIDTVTIAKNRHGNTPIKPMPLLTYTLRMSLSLANAAPLLRRI